MRKIEITCRYSGRVLFAHEAENNTTRMTVGAAAKAGVNLAGANLQGENLSDIDLTSVNLACAYLARAYLARAYLARVNLSWADLTGTDLTGAYLASADLTGADLTGADLTGVYLASTDLSGTNLEGAYMHGENGEKLTLVGRRPILQVGPIGSSSRYLVAFLTDKGIRLRTGCFFGTLERFEEKLADTHGDNVHAQEYRAALALIEAHERLWMPRTVERINEATQ